MPGDPIRATAWLRRTSGRLAGTRYRLREPVTLVGRDPSNDLVIEGNDASVVSGRHLEICRRDEGYFARDLNSTNGTFIEGERISEAALPARTVLHLGRSGPAIVFELDEDVEPVDDKTQPLTTESGDGAGAEISAASASRPLSSSRARRSDLVADAVERARAARRSGQGDQTGIIMQEMLGKALHRSHRKFKTIIVALLLALLGLASYAYRAVGKMREERDDINAQIRAIETKLQTVSGDPAEIERLIDMLNQYQEQARTLQRNILYKLGVREPEQDFVEAEIKTLLAEFGAEVYSVPPDFLEQVQRYLAGYTGPDRPHVQRVLGKSRKDLEAVRRILQGENLPQDLAYMVLVESAFIRENSSSAGAAGLWQFTAATARAYGMQVDEQRDERLDIEKSTRAACRYIRELILDFGAGSSVMLALAAYNLGPGKVKRAVNRVEDPIKQRNFWYLYRIRALPEETRQYVPKILAAMVIGRNPERYGFGTE